MDIQPKWIEPVLERLDRVEAMLGELIRERAVKDWYSTGEVAEILHKAEIHSARMAPARPRTLPQEEQRPRQAPGLGHLA